MKVDDVVVIVTLVPSATIVNSLPEEENCSFGFVKDQKQDEMMMYGSGVAMMLILQSLNIFSFDQSNTSK